MKPINLGTRIHSILYGGRDGTVVAIHGEARPDSIINFPGISTGGNAEYDIAWDNGGRSMRVPECIARGAQWRLLDEPECPEQIPALLQMAIEHAEATRRAEVEKELAKAAAHQRMLQEHPELSTENTPAKNIRIQLKRAFPGIKFSVRSDHGAIYISWTDGPTNDEVTRITCRYQAGHFDGMNDCYEYDHDRAWPFGSVRYVFDTRHMSEASRAALAACVDKEYANDDEYDQQRIRRQIYNETSLPAGHEITGIEWIDDQGHIATHAKASQPSAEAAH